MIPPVPARTHYSFICLRQVVGGSCFDCLPYLWFTLTTAGPPPQALTTAPLQSAMTYGMLLITTNGGTVWRNIPLFYTFQTTYSTAMVGDVNMLTNLYKQKIPGFLFSVQSDGSGKHVYAVGGSRYSGTVTTAPPYTVSYTMTGAPTILYSGNKGASWCEKHPQRPTRRSAERAALLLGRREAPRLCTRTEQAKPPD